MYEDNLTWSERSCSSLASLELRSLASFRMGSYALPRLRSLSSPLTMVVGYSDCCEEEGDGVEVEGRQVGSCESRERMQETKEG